MGVPSHREGCTLPPNTALADRVITIPYPPTEAGAKFRRAGALRSVLGDYTLAVVIRLVVSLIFGGVVILVVRFHLALREQRPHLAVLKFMT